MKKSNIIAIVVIVVVLFIGIGFWRWKKAMNTENAVKTSNYADAKIIKKEQVTFTINEYRLTNDEVPKNVVVTQGREVFIRLEINTKQAIDPMDIRINIKGANESKLNVSQPNHDNDDKLKYTNYDRTFNYETKYTPQNDGIDIINISIGNVTLSSKVIAYSTAFIMTPSSLDINQVSFDTSNFLKIEKTKKAAPYFGDSGAWFDINTPSSIVYSFSDSQNDNGKASLTIYTVSPDVENFQSLPYIKEIPNAPIYIENFLKLKGVIGSYPDIPKGKVPNLIFPPANASCVGPNRPQFISRNEIKGIRFMIYGCYQAVDIAKPPTYIFQGITDDGKYHIVFRYDNMISPKLQNYNPQIVENTLENQAAASKESLKLLISEKDNDFQPALHMLDNFVKSIKLNY